MGGKPSVAPQTTAAAAPAPAAVAEPDVKPDAPNAIRRNSGNVNDTLLTGGQLGSPSAEDPNTRRRSLLGSTASTGLA